MDIVEWVGEAYMPKSKSNTTCHLCSRRCSEEDDAWDLLSILEQTSTARTAPKSANTQEVNQCNSNCNQKTVE